MSGIPSRLLAIWLFVAGCFGTIGDVRAALSAAQVAQARASTGLLLSSTGQVSGVAVCISESGLFVTHSSLGTGAGDKEVILVLDPGKNEKRCVARVVQVFGQESLAILKVNLDRRVPALRLGDSNLARPSQPITVLSFSREELSAAKQSPYPVLQPKAGTILAVERKYDQIENLLYDAPAARDLIGTPILDAAGALIGLTSGANHELQGNDNFAVTIPVLRRTAWLPIVSFEAPAVAPEKRFAPADFKISVEWVFPPRQEPAVLFEITNPGMPRRVAAAKGADQKYRATLAPMLPPAAKKCQVVLGYQNAELSGTIDDFTLMVDGQPKALSELRTIRKSRDGKSYTVGGKAAPAVPELGKVNLDVGGTLVPVDLREVLRIQVTPPVADGPLNYQIVLVPPAGGVALASAQGKFTFAGTPAPEIVRLVPAIEPPPVPATPPLPKRTYLLPSAFDDVVAAEGGRVLLFRLKGEKRLAVFDVKDLKMRGYLDLPAEDASFAGGLRCVLVADPVEKVLHRYSVETLLKERTAALPAGTLQYLVMGHASPSLALLVMDNGTPGGPEGKFWDADKMAVVGEAPAAEFRQLSDRQAMIIRPSADGRTYGIITPGSNPHGFGLLTFKDQKAAYFKERAMYGVLVPNADGSIIYTAKGIPFTPGHVHLFKSQEPLYFPGNVAGISVGDSTDGRALVYAPVRKGEPFRPFIIPPLQPSYQPSLAFSIPYDESQGVMKKNVLRTLSIYPERSEFPLLSFREPFPELTDNHENSAAPAVTADKRFHLMPQFNVFVTLPLSNDRLVVRTLNVEQALKEKKAGYLYITSVPPLARRLQAYSYQLQAASGAGTVAYALQTGPAGLAVSPAGLVSWMPPANARDESVIVALKDSAGREALNTFRITLTP